MITLSSNPDENDPILAEASTLIEKVFDIKPAVLQKNYVESERNDKRITITSDGEFRVSDRLAFKKAPFWAINDDGFGAYEKSLLGELFPPLCETCNLRLKDLKFDFSTEDSCHACEIQFKNRQRLHLYRSGTGSGKSSIFNALNDGLSEIADRLDWEKHFLTSKFLMLIDIEELSDYLYDDDRFKHANTAPEELADLFSKDLASLLLKEFRKAFSSDYAYVCFLKFIRENRGEARFREISLDIPDTLQKALRSKKLRNPVEFSTVADHFGRTLRDSDDYSESVFFLLGFIGLIHRQNYRNFVVVLDNADRLDPRALEPFVNQIDDRFRMAFGKLGVSFVLPLRLSTSKKVLGIAGVPSPTDFHSIRPLDVAAARIKAFIVNPTIFPEYPDNVVDETCHRLFEVLLHLEEKGRIKNYIEAASGTNIRNCLRLLTKFAGHRGLKCRSKRFTRAELIQLLLDEEARTRLFKASVESFIILEHLTNNSELEPQMFAKDVNDAIGETVYRYFSDSPGQTRKDVPVSRRGLRQKCARHVERSIANGRIDPARLSKSTLVRKEFRKLDASIHSNLKAKLGSEKRRTVELFKNEICEQNQIESSALDVCKSIVRDCICEYIEKGRRGFIHNSTQRKDDYFRENTFTKHFNFKEFAVEEDNQDLGYRRRFNRFYYTSLLFSNAKGTDKKLKPLNLLCRVGNEELSPAALYLIYFIGTASDTLNLEAKAKNIQIYNTFGYFIPALKSFGFSSVEIFDALVMLTEYETRLIYSNVGDLLKLKKYDESSFEKAYDSDEPFYLTFAGKLYLDSLLMDNQYFQLCLLNIDEVVDNIIEPTEEPTEDFPYSPASENDQDSFLPPDGFEIDSGTVAQQLERFSQALSYFVQHEILRLEDHATGTLSRYSHVVVSPGLDSFIRTCEGLLTLLVGEYKKRRNSTESSKNFFNDAMVIIQRTEEDLHRIKRTLSELKFAEPKSWHSLNLQLEKVKSEFK